MSKRRSGLTNHRRAYCYATCPSNLYATKKQIVGFRKTEEDKKENIPLFWSSPTDSPTVLPTGTYTSVIALRINERGNIIGNSEKEPLFWNSPSTTPFPIHPGEYTSIQVFGLNDLGNIVGFAYDQTKLLYWDSPITPPTIISSNSPYGENENISGIYLFSVYGINNQKQIVGNISTNNGSTPLFWPSPSSDPVPLPLGNNQYATPLDINVQGQIVGFNNLSEPLIWSSHKANPIPVPTGGYNNINISGINANGNMVGQYSDDNFIYHPLYWSSPTANPDTISSDIYSNVWAFGIN